MSDPWRKAWLAAVDEPVLEPERRIVDPHHHLWHELNNLPRPYLAADLLDDVRSGHAVTQTVYVQAGETGYRGAGPSELRPVGETEFVLEQAAALDAAGGPAIGGIVGAYS